MTAALQGERLSRTFTSAAGEVHACVDVDVLVEAGELLVVTGRSGAGKTTLLNMLGGLDQPTSGRVLVGDTDIASLSEERQAELRRDRLGFIFQSFGLVPILTAAENVELPLRIAKTQPAEREARVQEALELVGLSAHAAQRPTELSGGQQQRVGIARAIAHRPEVLIADEPTAQLDSQTAGTVIDLIVDLVRTQGIAAIVATHDPRLIQRADRVIALQNGEVMSEPTAVVDELETPEVSAVPDGGEVADRPLTRAELRRAREQQASE